MIHVEDLDELRIALRAETDAVLVLTQPATCIPCQRLYPHLEKFAAKHTYPRIFVVDLDKVPEAMVDYDVMKVPTVLRFKSGEPAGTVQARTIVLLENELL